jgi:hypothetical protein
MIGITILSFLFLSPLASGAAPLSAAPSATGGQITPMKGSQDLGIVFSTGDLLLDLESYQGGLGGKIGWGAYSLRGAFDFLLSSASGAFSISAGATGEYHLIPGPVSPYVGCFLDAGYMREGEVSSSIPVSFGCVAGAEVFILDFLSVFAEYALACDLSITTDIPSATTTFGYAISTKMGNSSKLGVVLYVSRLETKK